MGKEMLMSFAAALFAAGPSWGQIPDSLAARLLFTLGGAPAGEETFRLERAPGGGRRLTGDVELQIPGLHIVQHAEVEAGDRLAFRHARVWAVVNGDTSEVVLERDGGHAIQRTVRKDSTASSSVATPESSVLLSSNVAHHVVQFAWLHDAGLGDTVELVAFPRVPVKVTLADTGTVSRDGRDLAVRRYYLNIANRLGAYVWLARDGTPLKVLVPLQAFEAVNEVYRDWSKLLTLRSGAQGPGAAGAPSYRSEDARFESDTITLAGTLTLPDGRGPWPAVVLISGSGPQDRDENTPGPGGLKMGIFRSIADTLTRRGIAVLRYDDRGVAGSGGDFASAGLSDFVTDVEAAVRFLRARPEIDAGRVALVGHSEGAIIAPIVAAQDTGIAAVVLMAGTAAPLDSVLVEQVVGATREAGGDSTDLARAREAVEELSRAVKEGRTLEETDLPPALKALGRGKWLREHLAHDPLATLRRVRAPVLIVNGGQDVQVAPEHARRLGAALDAVGHRDHEVKIFPRLNHLFAVSRGEGTAEYADPNARVDPGLLGYLADWLTARLTVSRPRGGAASLGVRP